MRKIGKFNPSGAELINHHVSYEFDMLNGTFAKIEASTDRIITNALIESFCVHARALIEFFEKPRGARQYTISNYTPFKEGNATRRKQLVIKLNNQISHLLDGRTANSQDKIGTSDRLELHSIIAAEYEKFRSHLDPQYINPQSQTVVVSPPQPSATNDITTSQTTKTNTISINLK